MIKTAMKASKPVKATATKEVKERPVVGDSGHLAGTSPLDQVGVQGEVVVFPQKVDGRGKSPGSQSTQIKPGQTLNPGGKPKGSRNKLQADFMRELADAFDKRGKQAIYAMIDEKPTEFIKVCASLMPRELEVTTNALDEMTSDQLDTAIAALDVLMAQQKRDVIDVEVKQPESALLHTTGVMLTGNT